jgi:hypothetical protein
MSPISNGIDSPFIRYLLHGHFRNHHQQKEISCIMGSGWIHTKADPETKLSCRLLAAFLIVYTYFI